MSIMKKVLVLLVSILSLISCSSDDYEPVCECEKSIFEKQKGTPLEDFQLIEKPTVEFSIAGCNNISTITWIDVDTLDIDRKIIIDCNTFNLK